MPLKSYRILCHKTKINVICIFQLLFSVDLECKYSCINDWDRVG